MRIGHPLTSGMASGGAVFRKWGFPEKRVDGNGEKDLEVGKGSKVT